MEAREVARGEWGALLARLGRKHASQPISIETSCWETCSVYQRVRSLPLRELCIEASEPPDEEAISITVGESAESAVTHTVVHPVRVLFEPAAPGEPQTLRVESEGGIVTTVLFLVD